MTVPFLYVNGNLTLVLNGKSKTVGKDHPNYKAIRDGLKNLDADAMLKLIDPKTKVEEAVKVAQDLSEGKVTITSGVVYYDGERVEQCLTDEIANLQLAGLPIEGMIRFIERLYTNLSSRNRKELLSFVQRNGLTIDSNGYLIAYKAVRSDYMDKYSGTISYKPGNVVEMNRGKVDDDFRNHCSKGLHAGALQYVYWYGGGNDRIVIVRIDPSDVVSVPSDHDCQKLRTCKLEVIGDYQGELKQTVYNAEASVNEMYESDWDEKDEDDDFDWSSVEEYDEYDDEYDDDEEIEDEYFDNVDSSEVSVNKTVNEISEYGVKPDQSSQAGRRFYNRRGPDGRFARQ